MKKIWISIQGLILAPVATALGADVTLLEKNGLDVKDQDRISVAGGGTGTCLADKKGSNIQISGATVSELKVLDLIRDRLANKNEAEKNLILEKLDEMLSDVEIQK